MRRRVVKLVLVLGVVSSSAAVAGLPVANVAAASSTSSAASSSTTPACTFDGGTFPIVTGVTDGSKVDIQCTGLEPLHPYLMLEASLLIGIDPKAASLLSGGGSVGIGTLEGALAALPEINPAGFAVPISNLSGDLSETYTVPSFNPTDPNAACPPSLPEFNSGLIGCAIAMVDPATQKPVAAGSGLLEWTGYPLLPPDPTLAFSTSISAPGQQVTVSDAPGATTYWWLATLASLETLLGGSSAPTQTMSVYVLGKHQTEIPATNNVTVTPAAYNGKTLTPPVLSGSFTVPSGVRGRHQVYVVDSTSLEGLPLSISAHEPLRIVK
jgi:hypothetical protein